MRFAKTFLMLLCLLPSGSVLAAEEQAAQQPYAVQTGDDLARICANPASPTLTPPDRERLVACGSYIRGYLGYYSAHRSVVQSAEFCLPEHGVSAEKLRILYVAVLSKRPQIRDYPAAIDLTSILKAAYPCAAAKPLP